MPLPKDDCSSPIDWSRVSPCRFAAADQRRRLKFRNAPYWHGLARCRQIGIYQPNRRVSTWTARVLTKEKRYLQRRLGPAVEGNPGALSYDEALQLAIAWFESDAIKAIAEGTRPIGRTRELNFCPIGEVYSVGAALVDYITWSRIARSAGGHYNNLVHINYHLANDMLFVPLEDFNASHLREIAVRIFATHSSRAYKFSDLRDVEADELRRAKRAYNAVVSILRMAFQHAWDIGRISSERPWRCLHRIAVTPAARTLFLDRDECRTLISNCTPALARLVLAGLYTGCRVGELSSLRVSDVGREVFGLHVPAFKQGPARFVFLPDEAMAFFLSCCEGKKPGDRLLVSDKGMVWTTQHANLFRRAVKRSGLPSAFVFHGLRHTYASDLVRHGVALTIVARQLGHADIRSVSATYGHLAEQFREEQVRTKFSPLSSEFQAEAIRRASQLEALWGAIHRRDWRSYGAELEAPARQTRSSVRTSLEVLDAFGIRD